MKVLLIPPIVLFQGFYKINMNGKLGKLQFSSGFEAKVHVFLLFESGDIDRYLKKSGSRSIIKAT